LIDYYNYTTTLRHFRDFVGRVLKLLNKGWQGSALRDHFVKSKVNPPTISDKGISSPQSLAVVWDLLRYRVSPHACKPLPRTLTRCLVGEPFTHLLRCLSGVFLV